MLDEILMANSVPKIFRGKNLIGHKFGYNNIVLAYLGKNNKHHSQWLVKCGGCNREWVLPYERVFGKNVTLECIDCLTKRKSQIKEDLTNYEFGDSIVLGYGGRKGKRILWKVKCKICGKENLCDRNSIITKPRKSCRSCSAKKVTNRRKDLSGKIFGKECIILQEKNINEERIFIAECGICKKQFEVKYSQVFNKTKTCKKCYIESISGYNNYRYNNNLENKDRIDRRTIFGYTKLVKDTYKRDNYRCVICGRNDYLCSHHLDSYAEFPNKRFDINNCITLCSSRGVLKGCHEEFHGLFNKNRKNTIYEFIDFLWIKYSELNYNNYFLDNFAYILDFLQNR
jgi:hypothetical protein